MKKPNEAEVKTIAALMNGTRDDAVSYLIGYQTIKEAEAGVLILRNPRNGKAWKPEHIKKAEAAFNGMWDYAAFCNAMVAGLESEGEFIRNKLIKALANETAREIFNKLIDFSEDERR